MPRRTQHPTDGELLLLDDPQALGGCREREIRQHIAQCAPCTARRSRLAAELAEVGALRRGSTGAAEAEGGEPASEWATTERERVHRVARDRLAARLDARVARDASIWSRVADRPRTLLPVAAATLVVLALVTAPQLLEVGPPDFGRRAGAPTEEPRPVAARLLPDRRLTPGAVRPVTAVEACRGEDRSAPPAFSAAEGVLRQVFARYGIDHRRAGEYELDFLITPELGGAAEPRNLWPQPYGAPVWNAYVKDELERHLRRMVCAGTLDLATAQREIATDWIGAYRRYFDTRQPRRDERRLPLAGPDGGSPANEPVRARREPLPVRRSLLGEPARRS